MPNLTMWAAFDPAKISLRGCFLLGKSCPGFFGCLFDVGFASELAETRSKE